MTWIVERLDCETEEWIEVSRFEKEDEALSQARLIVSDDSLIYGQGKSRVIEAKEDSHDRN